MRQLAVPAAQKAQEEDDDRRPKWEMAHPTTKKDWSSTIGSMKRMVSNLTDNEESALFRASQFPSCLHAEADLKGKKPFKDATLRTNVTGACGLALVRCGKMAFLSLGKDSTLMSRLHDAIAGDTPRTSRPSFKF
jgi:hypothetical protein